MMTFLRRLARVMVRPRTTMREILDSPHRQLLPLLLLGSFSALIGNSNEKGGAGTALNRVPHGWWILAGAVLVAMLVTIGFFYLFAWIAYHAGKFLEGQGTHADVRAALAWGLAPIIWALLYRLPATFLRWGNRSRPDAPNEMFTIRMNEFSAGCLAALIFGTLELAMLVWYVVVTSRTLGEAHRFSAWRGLGTLVIIGITPIVILIAAVMSFHH